MVKIILSLVYWVIVTPIGFVLRCCGKDFLALHAFRRKPSYWIKRTHAV